jgi:hypothetical protein
MRDVLLLLFALAGGLTLSGIAANAYRLLAPKASGKGGKVQKAQKALYYAIMAVAGPSVLVDNATKSFRSQNCTASAYAFALMLAAYWSFAIGVVILLFSVGPKFLQGGGAL